MMRPAPTSPVPGPPRYIMTVDSAPGGDIVPATGVGGDHLQDIAIRQLGDP